MAAETVSHTTTTILLLLLMVTVAVGPRHAGATEYTVGDSDGWSIGGSYLAWSQKYNFTAGDTLVFNYVRGQHDVFQVTQDAYRTCEAPAAAANNNKSTVLRAWASGHDVVDLPAPGDYYFICNVTGHCLGGMKLAVTVGAVPSSPPPPPGFTMVTRFAPPPGVTFHPRVVRMRPISGASSERLAETRVSRLAVAVVGLWIGLLLL